MRILALDQAARTTGYAIYDIEKDGSYKLCQYGHFTIPANEIMGKRLDAFYDKIEFLVTRYLPIDKIYFEGIQYQNNISTYQTLAYVQAIIMYLSAFQKLPYEQLMPSHWRGLLREEFNFKFGKARAEQKKRAKEFVLEHFNLEASEDECDAICLGLAAVLENNKHRSAF